MRISFDIDDTLILYEDHNPEPNRVPWYLRLFYAERLRAGTVELLKRLANDGWEIWIYTTSDRSIGYIRTLFRFYNITVDDIINQARHQEAFRGRRGHAVPSKYPSRWRIDLHVDDCEILEKNGERYGFRVLRIDPQDSAWADKVYAKAGQLQSGEIEK